ncbi:hypothetical protein [Arthrobacter sp. MMS18-M83]|uniref:hypothetical protein n=1 Tax=Arthrobacter sp. MMS18-M83 TaxID=2996261 RepID=UPI00227A4893|nr:hypothetical protein [Arthrobacter sp. MMS18-M83]WAH97281.1 hypothetical protein OW521_23570 [Arthrobacter sp. MMS18-M83]
MKKKMPIFGSCLLLAGLLVGSPAARASTLPPTLAGEIFSGEQGGFDTVRINCPKSVGPGVFTLHASGTAAGPYPGTFTEDISVASTPNSGSEALVTFHATFTITSPEGTVTGTKDLDPGSAGFARCFIHSSPHGGPSFGAFDAPSLTYSTEISTGGFTYQDRGSASASLLYAHLFTETFLTSQGLSPTAKDQCKKDGWTDYPQFKNQGRCVSYVNHQDQS